VSAESISQIDDRENSRVKSLQTLSVWPQVGGLGAYGQDPGVKLEFRALSTLSITEDNRDGQGVTRNRGAAGRWRETLWMKLPGVFS
jgi:hypothetical protein